MSIRLELNDPMLLLSSSRSVQFSLSLFLDLVMSILCIEDGTFSFTFMDDDHISNIHEQHLGVAGPTDIITYTLDINPYDVDIYIGVHTVERNAMLYENSFEDELKMVLVHGVLHVLGWDDATDDDRNRMFLEQDRVLSEFKKG